MHRSARRSTPPAPCCAGPRGGTEQHIMGAAHQLAERLTATAADPLSQDNPVPVVAHADALALLSRSELDGTM
jgi:hypothetical protein